MTDRQRFWLKIGLTCAAMGVAALILPHFGLQFRKLERLGPNAAAGAWGLIVVGGVLCLPALLRIRLRMMAAAAGAVLVVGLGLMFVLGWLLSKNRSMPSPPPPNTAYTPPTNPVGAPPHMSGGPGYTGPRAPAGSGPPRFSPGNRPPMKTFEERRSEIETRYGADRIWIVRIENADEALNDALTTAFRDYRSAADNPGSWSTSRRGDELRAISAPESSPESLLQLVRGVLAGVEGAGEPRVDESAREITVTITR